MDQLIGYFLEVIDNYHQDHESLDLRDTVLGRCVVKLCHDVPSFRLLPNAPQDSDYLPMWSSRDITAWWSSWLWGSNSDFEGSVPESMGEGGRHGGDGDHHDTDQRHRDHGDGKSPRYPPAPPPDYH